MTGNIPAAEILIRNDEWLRRMARALMSDPDQADDAAQSAALRALTHPPRDLRSERGWIASLVRRQGLEAIGRRQSRLRREREAARPESQPSTAELTERLALQRDLVDAVESLSQAQRDVILHRFWGNRMPAEIAGLLGMPVATVKTHLSRGLEALRNGLERRHGRDAWRARLAPLALASRPRRWILPLAAPRLAAALVALLLLVFGCWFAWQRNPSTPSPIGAGIGRDLAAANAAPLDGGFRRSSRPEVIPVPEPATPPEKTLPPSAPGLRVRVIDDRDRPVADVPVVLVERRFLRREVVWRDHTDASGEADATAAFEEIAKAGRCSEVGLGFGFPVLDADEIAIDQSRPAPGLLTLCLPPVGFVALAGDLAPTGATAGVRVEVRGGPYAGNGRPDLGLGEFKSDRGDRVMVGLGLSLVVAVEKDSDDGQLAGKVAIASPLLPGETVQAAIRLSPKPDRPSPEAFLRKLGQAQNKKNFEVLVVDADGIALPGAEVVADPVLEGGFSATTMTTSSLPNEIPRTDAEGRVTLPVPGNARRLQLSVKARGFADLQQRCEWHDGVERLQMARGASVSGRLRLSRPAEGAQLRIVAVPAGSPPATAEVRRMPGFGPPAALVDLDAHPVRADGRFVLDGLAPGVVDVRVMLQERIVAEAKNLAVSAGQNLAPAELADVAFEGVDLRSWVEFVGPDGRRPACRRVLYSSRRSGSSGFGSLDEKGRMDRSLLESCPDGDFVVSGFVGLTAAECRGPGPIELQPAAAIDLRITGIDFPAPPIRPTWTHFLRIESLPGESGSARLPEFPGSGRLEPVTSAEFRLALPAVGRFRLTLEELAAGEDRPLTRPISTAQTIDVVAGQVQSLLIAAEEGR